MSIVRKMIFIGLAVLLLTGCDFTSKRIAEVQLRGKTVQSYLGGNLKLFYTENSAGMLGLGDEMSDNMKHFVFVIVTTVLLLTLLLYIIMKKEITKWQLFAFILFLSGGLGNLLDRIINNGKVTDFILIEFSNLHTGIFNLADFYVTIGVVIFLITSFVKKKDSPPDDAASVPSV